MGGDGQLLHSVECSASFIGTLQLLDVAIPIHIRSATLCISSALDEPNNPA